MACAIAASACSCEGTCRRDFRQVVATILVKFLIVVPYLAFRSLGDIAGDKTLVRLFFERRRSA
jgi:hypothetical protein